MAPRRLHLIDGTFELFRAHFTKRPGHTAPNGQEVKATAGLLSNLLALLADPKELPTHLGVAFDLPIRSFRNDLFAGYKSDDGIDPELYAQFALGIEATEALGLVAWKMDRWEADDALATATARWKGEVEQVRILTPDKDLGQCLDGVKVVQVDRIRDAVIDEAAMTARRGVKPAQIPALLALIGDDADGIPGLAGFGEKGAAAVLSAHGSIAAIPDDPAQWKGKVRGAERLAETLRGQRKEAELYERLATLVTDVPLPQATLGALEWQGVPRARFTALCERLGLQRLLTRPTRWQP